MDWVPINFNIAGAWQNWFIVMLMLLIAGFALDQILYWVTDTNMPTKA